MSAAVSALVPGVRIGLGVSCTAYRNPGVTARMADMIQEVSDGRCILGLGAGWNPHDFAMLGLSFDPRVSRFDEVVQITHGLLRYGAADVRGEYCHANHALDLPRSLYGPSTPIMVGASGSRMMRVLARYGDACDTTWEGSNARLGEQSERLDEACRQVGRDPGTVTRSVGVAFAEDGASDDPGDIVLDSVEEKVRLLQELAGLGFQHVRIGLMPFSPETVVALAPVISAFHNHPNTNAR